MPRRCLALWVRSALLPAVLFCACSTAPAEDGGEGGGPGGGSAGPDGGVDVGPGPDGGGVDPGPDANPADLVPYAEAHFAATHNSYSGGDRGSILDQLEGGVRLIEFDVQDNDFSTYGYRIGHGSAGDQVDHGGGNPQSNELADWLAVVSSWSEAHPDHAPITVLFDLKDSLVDNWSDADGNLGRLNATLEDTFGSRLYRAESVTGDTMPTMGELRGKILTVLSGNGSSRLGYRRDQGFNPAVAIDSAGRVIEVHNSGGGELWYWIGELTPGGSVLWHKHTRYDTGEDPAVALNENGLVVEVHEDQDAGDDKLWYRVGHLTADFEINWTQAGGIKFPNEDTGVNPSVRFVQRDGLDVREIHRSENTGDHWYWNGTFNAGTGKIDWSRGSDGGQTSDPLYNTRQDSIDGQSVEVSRGAIGPYNGSTLRVRTPGAAWEAIRFPQVLFVEVQEGNSSLEADDLWFFAADARKSSGRNFVEGWRNAGRVTRLWEFSSANQETEPPVNYPATDQPLSSWYVHHCDQLDCRR